MTRIDASLDLRCGFQIQGRTGVAQNVAWPRLRGKKAVEIRKNTAKKRRRAMSLVTPQRRFRTKCINTTLSCGLSVLKPQTVAQYMYFGTEKEGVETGR
jgi:hypothetical protein